MKLFIYLGKQRQTSTCSLRNQVRFKVEDLKPIKSGGTEFRIAFTAISLVTAVPFSSIYLFLVPSFTSVQNSIQVVDKFTNIILMVASLVNTVYNFSLEFLASNSLQKLVLFYSILYDTQIFRQGRIHKLKSHLLKLSHTKFCYSELTATVYLFNFAFRKDLSMTNMTNKFFCMSQSHLIICFLLKYRLSDMEFTLFHEMSDVFLRNNFSSLTSLAAFSHNFSNMEAEVVNRGNFPPPKMLKYDFL